MDFEKSVKNAKWFAVGILVLAVIGISLRIFMVSSEFNDETVMGLNTIGIVLGIAEIGVIVGAIKGFNDKKQYGAICGIITSILLIISMDIISLIFGILYLIDCIKILNYMKKMNSN